MGGQPVNVDNFLRAETNRMFAALAAQAGGTNRWNHMRAPTPLDNQPIIRQNRDTLYSIAVMDLTQSATLNVPDSGGRYLSVMLIDQDHYVPRIWHDAGQYTISADDAGTRYAMLGARILVDPEDGADVTTVNALQNELTLSAGPSAPFVSPDYDQASFDETRNALLTLGRGLQGYERTFGRREDVDPVRHLIGTAVGWAGLPETEAYYENVEPHLPVGPYTLTVGEVPVDAFWSISLYNARGYFEQTDGLANVNSVTAERNRDGTVSVNFGGPADGRPNRLGIMDGWNYTIRFYRPRAEILNRSWTFPKIEPATV